MTDYHTVIAQAVEGLDQNTSRTRRALYERARAAQVTHLRAIHPPLSESAIAKERLSLESAIRKVEADTAGKSEMGLREPKPDVALLHTAAASMNSERSERATLRNGPLAFAESETSPPTRPLVGRLRRWLTSKRSPGSSDALNAKHHLDPTTTTTKDERDRNEGLTPLETSTSSRHAESGVGDLATANYATQQPEGRELSYDLDEDQEQPHPAQPLPQAMKAEHLKPLAPLRRHKLVKSVVALLILVGLAAIISWRWPHFSELYRSVAQIIVKQQSDQTVPQTASQLSFLDRFPREQSTAAMDTPGSQTLPTLAQRVVLYEEDSSDPQGKRYFGVVSWRTETVSSAQSSDVAVRADVKIPDRRITMTWLLRRNIDHALPASYTIEMMFDLPADFPGGGVAGVPGVLMKRSEQEPSTPLTNVDARATNGVFIIELSAADSDEQRNVQMLKESPWFDIPIAYNNGSRAILAIEKGLPGYRAFAKAFAVWEKK
jgi:hypothetical protein